MNGPLSFLAALVIGASGSVHCFLMCGPLACAAASRTGCGGSVNRTQPLRDVVAYHVGRLLAYATVGGFLGALGRGVAKVLAVSVRPVAPWILAATLVAAAFGLADRLTPIPAIARALRALSAASRRLPASIRPGVLGALTPLLPCGLLYGVFAAAATSGTALSGGLVLLGFGLGAVPALVAAQAQIGWLRRRRFAPHVHRALLLLAAVVVVYRALTMTTGGRCH